MHVTRLPVVILSLAFALAAPPGAQAHLRTGRVATDYRADVSPLRSPLSDALAVRIYRSDLAIRLSGRGLHEILVLGDLREPLLRLGPTGVEVAAASPTAAGEGASTVICAKKAQRFLNARRTSVLNLP
jgi:hypothetical protein